MANTKKDAKSSGSGNSKSTTKPTQEKNPSQDEIKKRRGRPKKTPKSAGNVVNENEKQISMSASSANLVNDFNSNPNQLPQVTSSTTNLAEKYTLEGIENRWASIFGRYASMGFDTVANAWTKAWSQLNNPFVQNFRVKQIVGRSRKLKQEEKSNLNKNSDNKPSKLKELLSRPVFKKEKQKLLGYTPKPDITTNPIVEEKSNIKSIFDAYDDDVSIEDLPKLK